MKQKFLYVGFVLVTIFLLIFINRKNNVSQHPLEEKMPQELSLEQQSLLAQGTHPLITSEGKSRITIIGKFKSEEKTILPESKKVTPSVSSKKASASSSSGSTTVSNSTKTGEGAVEKPVAGVTKIGKRPTPEQINELNEQGIVMY